MDAEGFLERRLGESNKAFVNKLMASMKWEETTLHGYIEKYRLEEWFAATAETAKRAIAAIADEATRVGAGYSQEGSGQNRQALGEAPIDTEIL